MEGKTERDSDAQEVCLDSLGLEEFCPGNKENVRSGASFAPLKNASARLRCSSNLWAWLSGVEVELVCPASAKRVEEYNKKGSTAAEKRRICQIPPWIRKTLKHSSFRSNQVESRHNPFRRRNGSLLTPRREHALDGAAERATNKHMQIRASLLSPQIQFTN